MPGEGEGGTTAATTTTEPNASATNTSGGDGNNAQSQAGAQGAGTQTATTTEGAQQGEGSGAAPAAGDQIATLLAQAKALGVNIFTQEDLNTTVQKRLADEEARQQRAKEEEKKREQGKFQELLTDRERELQEARDANRALALKYETATVAHRLGIDKPETVMKLVSKDAIEYGTDGNPTNLETLLKSALEELQGLVKVGSQQTTATSAGDGINAARKTPLTKAAIQAMSFAERQARKDEIFEALKQGLAE